MAWRPSPRKATPVGRTAPAWARDAGHYSGTYMRTLRELSICRQRADLDCDCDEEARPRSGYRSGAPGGRQVEHVDEHLRAAAWMGASPLPPAWCRVKNLHARLDHHSRDCGCRNRAHRATSQPRLTPGRRTWARDSDHFSRTYVAWKSGPGQLVSGSRKSRVSSPRLNRSTKAKSADPRVRTGTKSYRRRRRRLRSSDCAFQSIPTART